MRFFVLLLMLLTAACSGSQAEHTADFYDPIESINRRDFALNAKLDSIFLEPVAKQYNKLPSPVRARLTNHAQWLGQPSIAMNSTLQGRLENAGLATVNFLVNGLSFGFADLTGSEDNPESADFGMTLASWSVAEGPYFLLPFLGPGTSRHQTGRLVDGFLNPLGHIKLPATEYVENATLPIQGITARADNFDQINAVKYQSADPYAKTRSLYYQYRRGQVQNLISGESSDNSNSDALFDDFFDDEENGENQ